MKTYFIYFFLIFLVPVLCFADKAQNATLVETQAITQGTLSNSQTFIGSIHYKHSSILASKTEGLVLKVNFDTTSSINEGDILVELDHEILDSKIRSIQASLKELKLLDEKSSKDLARYKKLLQQKNVSQQKYDEIYYEKSRLDQQLISSQAKLEALLLEQKQSIITAPFKGVITERHVELGEWVDEGGKIATLVNPEKITALFDIPAYFAMNVKPGTELSVNIAGHDYQGTIDGVIIQGDKTSRTFPLKLTIEATDARLYEGMEAQISLPETTHTNSLLVPRDAIIERFGHNVIFVVNNDTAIMYPITVLLYDGSLAAISQSESSESTKQEEQNNPDLQAGMLVITKGNERIFPGQAIKLK